MEALLATDLRHDPEALVRQAVRANIRASANHLRHGSEVLERLIQHEGLLVVGAEYSLETGSLISSMECPMATGKIGNKVHRDICWHSLRKIWVTG